MAEIASAFVTIAPSMKGFGRDLTSQASGQIDGASKGLGSKFGSAFATAAKVGLAAAGVAVVAFGKAAVDAASDAQQSLGATETVFGKFSDAVVKASDGAAQKFGLSANEYRENANLIGSLFKNQGVSLDQLGGKTDQMIGRASDLAATFGGDTKTAVEALGSAFKGEFDSLEKYGISLKESTVSALLAKRGQDELTGSAAALAKQQAITDLIFKQSKDSAGAFAAEAGTLAGQQQRLGASFENLKTTIGTALLPVATQFFKYLNVTALPALSKIGAYLSTNFAPAFERVRSVVAGFFNGSSGDAGKWAENIKSIIRDAVAIATKLWNTFGQDIVRYATTALRNTQQIIGGALNVIAGIFKTVSAIMRGDWSAAWNGIKQITSGAKDVVVGIVRQLANVAQTVLSAGLKALVGIARASMEGMATAIRVGVDKAISFIKSLPGRAASALGNLSGILVNAGRQIIDGLIAGIQSKLSDLGSVLGGVGSYIKSKKGPPEYDKVMLTPQGRMIMDGLIKGIESGIAPLGKALEGAGAKIREALTAERERLRSVLDGIKSDFASLKDSVASAFAPDLFQAATYEDYMRQAGQSFGDLRSLRQAFRKLKDWGISSQFLSQLFASGNAPLILDLAAGTKTEASFAASAYGMSNNLARGLGGQVAGYEFGKNIDRVVNKLDRIEKAIDRQGREFGRELNGAAAAAQRRRR